jgi:acid phosphatase (class A)
VKRRLLSVCFLLVVFAINANAGQPLVSPVDAPSSLAVLPPPPSANSAAFQADIAASKAAFIHHSHARWLLAQQDADLSSPQKVANDFQAAFGHRISQKETPAIYRLIEEVMRDQPPVTRSAKNHYMRKRPFMYFHAQTCYPKRDAFLKLNGSYPSGHTTIGWATALVLAEINPTLENQILKRGFEFGQSRVVCGAHWQSDVDEGRVTGAMLFAKLQTSQVFQALIKQARHEVGL